MKIYEYTYPLENDLYTQNNSYNHYDSNINDASYTYDTSYSHDTTYSHDACYSHIEEDAIFFDMETTGLKRDTSIIYLIGCAYKDGDHLRLIQWFNDDAVSEEMILKAFLAFLEIHPGPLVSFNGNSFDLPFILAHLAYNELSDQILRKRKSIDLYVLLRGYAKVFKMKKSTQKSWEEHLGIHREDQYDGGRLIAVYKDYIKTKDPQLEKLLLLHNEEDIHYLSVLPALLSYEQLKNGDFSVIHLQESTRSSVPAMEFHLKMKYELPKSFEVNASIGSVRYEKRNQKNLLLVTIPVKEEKMYHFYSDYKNYFYLPLEDRAVHKSIGAYVDVEHREKAKKCNCYSPLEGIFMPAPTKQSKLGFCIQPLDDEVFPQFRNSYESKERYVNFEDLFEENQISESVNDYLARMIQMIFLSSLS